MNKRVKVIGTSLLSFLCLVSLAACKKDKVTEDVKITLNESAIEMVVGETYELKASVSPADVVDKKIVWTSTDDGIASVKDGTVTAKAEGEATIKAETNGREASCKVTVTDKKPDGDSGENPAPEN